MPAPIDVPPQEVIEFLTDCIQVAWTRRATIQPRGFDSIRARAALMAEIDDMLEELAIQYHLLGLDAEEVA